MHSARFQSGTSSEAIAAALVAAVLFGLATPMAKQLAEGMHPVMLAGLLYAGSGIGLGAFVATRVCLTRESTRRVALPGRMELGWLAAAVVAGGIAAPVLLIFGLARLPASTTALLLNTESVFTALFAWFVFRENFDRRVVAGMGLIVAGGALLAWPHDATPVATGAIAVVGACICWALDNNLTRKVAAGDAMLIAGVKGLVAGAVNLVLGIAIGGRLPTTAVMLEAGAIGFFGYGLSLTLFVYALRHLGAARTGAYFSVAPFVGAAFAIVVTGEAVTMPVAIAGALMALGVWLHLSERHDHMHRHDEWVHEHSHVHDIHHRHAHGPEYGGREPHTHRHAHVATSHRHRHFPDIHHQHEH